MEKTAGYMQYERKLGPVKPEAERVHHFHEFHEGLPLSEQKKQAERCMDCGIPFCQSGTMIAGMASGCPLHNLVPEVNHLLQLGRMEEAYRRLSITHSFPEFTSRVCPALCEAACTCGYHDEAVSTKENERAVIEYAYAQGLVEEPVPPVRTGKRVAVVGSGPSGLAAAALLNRRGHEVTVYERKDRPGGLLMYGIPNMKLEKSLVLRRVHLMEKAGVHFVLNANVGKDIPAKELLQNYDSVILACGASKPRDLAVPGRDAEGIYFAVDFLSKVTKSLLDSDFKDVPVKLAEGKDVIIIGGGDTGNDCAGTCIRLGAKSVTQLEMMPEPPHGRLPSNPWPEWPRILKVDYGQEEAIWKFGSDPRVYQTTVKEFVKDKKGKLKSAVLVSLSPKRDEKTGRMSMVPIPDSERVVPAQLVLIAAGFLGSEDYVAESFGVERDARSNIKTLPGEYASSVAKVFAAGDVHRGQSLVVWAISEGRRAARAVDLSLMGYSNL